MALTAAHHASRATAYLSKSFHRDVKFWQYLCANMVSRPTYIAEIVQRLATDVGYTDASGLGCGGVLIDPDEDGIYYVWRLPWPEDIKADLVSSENTQGQITNSDIELTALVLQEAKFTFVGTNLTWQAPFAGSNNTPPVAWKFQEYSAVNPVVSELLCLRSLVNRQFNITSSVFYHLGPQSTMADGAS